MLEVVGPTLTLRLPALDDVPALFALAGDPEVTRRFAWGPYRSEAEPRAWVQGAAARREAGEALELVIARDGEPLGVTSLLELSRRDRRATTGTWLGRAHWGTGANAESKALLFALAFGPVGLERLTAYADTGHGRSQRALESLGFAREGVLRSWHRHPDGPHDLVVYGLLKSEWRSDVPVEIRGAPPAAFSCGATPS
ncbi:MAG: GNAT family N-acetyltransferase [Solirubrobacteraceae bacterium]